MSNIIIAVDLHNTLVLSEDAWILAFQKLSSYDKEYIVKELKRKRSRKNLAKECNVSYEDIYDEYRKVLKPNNKVINVIKKISELGIPIVVVSSASYRRVINDLNDICKDLKIDKVCSKENFSKKSKNDWDLLMKEYECEQILFLGNDAIEDVIDHEKVVSVLVT